ncbi:Importin subunit alpha-4 [Entophlyctis sp. JEL0112]|nr:Importin subunit alpha-4 [Entophlyctis sp. JEL0112]
MSSIFGRKKDSARELSFGEVKSKGVGPTIDDGSNRVVRTPQHRPHRPHYQVFEDTDDDSDKDSKIASTTDLVEKLNAEIPHRGPQSKTTPRKKGVDVDNELETVSRKLLNVAFDDSSLANSLPTHMPNDPSAILHLLPTHGRSIISALNHPELIYVLNAVKQLRRYITALSDEIPDKTDRVLELNILPRLRELLVNSDTKIQYEVCWIITNIAAGTNEHTTAVVNAKMISPLIELLESSSDQVRVQAAWSLGNIAGDCKEYSQLLLEMGLVPPLLQVPLAASSSYRAEMQANHVVCWVIANLCRWNNKDWSQVELCFPFLSNIILHGKEEDVLSEAIWALSRIFHSRRKENDKLLTANILSKLVVLIHNRRPSIQTPVLRVMTNISGDQDPMHTEVLIQAGILPEIQALLQYNHIHSSNILAEALHCLSNITAGTTAQKEAVSSADLFEPVRQALLHGCEKVKKEACHVLRNAVDRDATPEHFREVVGPQGEIFEPLTLFLVESHRFPDVQLQVVETLNIIFSRGNEPLIRQLYPYAVHGTNVYVTCMNYLTPNNFERIWLAYEKISSVEDDLTPLLNQCVVVDREIEANSAKINSSGRSGVEVVVEHMKGMKANDFVKETRLKKALMRDMEIMLDTYLFVEKGRKLEDRDVDLNGVSSVLHGMDIGRAT